MTSALAFGALHMWGLCVLTFEWVWSVMILLIRNGKEREMWSLQRDQASIER